MTNPELWTITGVVVMTKAELYERLYKALDWVMHCHHDIGQDGNPPSHEEWDAALESAMEVLALIKKEKNNEQTH